MPSLKYLPDYESLTKAMMAYTEQDSELLTDDLRKRFNAVEMHVIEDRILANFIDNMASLFSSDFKRELEDVDPMTELLLTDSEQWAERYFHLFKKSAIYLDVSNPDLTKRIEALNPTEYFKDVSSGNFFVDDGNSTWLFEQRKDNVWIHKRKISFIEAVKTYDPSISIKMNRYVKKSELPTMPIIEWSYNKVNTATPSSIYSLEKEQISSMSYAIDAGNTKQTHQPIMSSDGDNEETKARVGDFGKSRKMILVGESDTITPYNAGSLQPLMDIITAYEKLSVRKAIAYGVSKDSVVPTTKIESGEALKVALGYVNNKRKKFYFSAKIFEAQVLEAMDILGFNVGKYSGITFYPIEVIQDKETLFNNIDKFFKAGYISFTEAISQFRGVTIEKAQELIEKQNLKPIDLLFNKEG